VTGAPKIAFVVARGRNGVIGAEGDLPWRLKSDMKIFVEATRGKPVVMGRKTWESLPRRPLPGRLNIVVTRQAGYAAQGAVVADTLHTALGTAADRAASDGVEEICVIGGAQIYAAAMERADRLYITEVDAEPPGDTRFPDFDERRWRELRREVHAAGEGDDHAFVFRLLERCR
jgi:dihydrofolate reductase